MVATNTYFLIVSVFEFSTTEWKSELREVNRWAGNSIHNSGENMVPKSPKIPRQVQE